jgi:hypothetical protein
LSTDKHGEHDGDEIVDGIKLESNSGVLTRPVTPRCLAVVFELLFNIVADVNPHPLIEFPLKQRGLAGIGPA